VKIQCPAPGSYRPIVIGGRSGLSVPIRVKLVSHAKAVRIRVSGFLIQPGTVRCRRRGVQRGDG
jgi:hypothetical protein